MGKGDNEIGIFLREKYIYYQKQGDKEQMKKAIGKY